MQNSSLITMNIYDTYWRADSNMVGVDFAPYLAHWIVDHHHSGPHMEFPSFSQILDPFKWLVLLSIHVKTAHLKTCTEETEAKLTLTTS